MVALGLLAWSPKNAEALPCYGLTQSNQLVSFDSTNPAVATMQAISGLGAFDLVGLDIRTTTQPVNPANPGVGSLWAIGTDGATFRLFVIDPATAVATPIGGDLPGVVDNGAGDNGWFFGFDPAIDRIRFMGFIDNYLIDPNTLSVIKQTDIAGFINFNGSAFSTAPFGGTSQPYLVEVASDELRTSPNIAAGITTPVGPLGVDISLPTGLDMFENTLLTIARILPDVTRLYSINLESGAATPVGPMSPDDLYRGLTIVPPVFPPPPDDAVTLTIAGKRTLRTRRPVARIRGTASSPSGIASVTYRVSGQRGVKRARGLETWRIVARKLTRTRHVIRITAASNAGSLSPTATVRVVRR